MCAVKEIETLMEDAAKWKALPQEEQQEHEQTLGQNCAHSFASLLSGQASSSRNA